MGSDDYVMVPREPTEEMLRASIEARFMAEDLDEIVEESHAYAALIAAAPPSPRSDDGSGLTPSTHGVSAALRAQVIEECAKVVENFSQIGMWEAARTRVCIAKAIRSLSAVSAEPDDDGLRVIEPLYLRPSPTRDETIEMCAKWHDEQAAQYDVKRQEWIERGLILAADKCDDLSDNHRRHAASIRSLKSTPDAEGE